MHDRIYHTFIRRLLSTGQRQMEYVITVAFVSAGHVTYKAAAPDDEEEQNQ